MPKVRPATEEDLEYLSTRLRPEDITEIYAMDGSTPAKALAESFAHSTLCKVMVTNDDEPFAIYGVGPLDTPIGPFESGAGVSWMLGTEKLASNSMWFLRNCHWMLDEMHEHFPTFGNLADERNTVHIQWLKWAGFEFGRRIPWGGTHFLEHWRTK